MGEKKSRQERTWYLMFQTSERLRNFIIRQSKQQKGVKRWKLSVSQLRLISCIVASPELKIKIKDIAKELSITSGGVSQLVDSLERLGLLVRCHDSGDRRIVFVTLSEQGNAIYRDSVSSHDAMFKRLLRDVPGDKLDTFHEVLHMIQTQLSDMESDSIQKVRRLKASQD